MRYIYICITIITLCEINYVVRQYLLFKKLEPMFKGIMKTFKQFGIDISIEKKPSELLQNPDDKENVN